MLMASIGPTHVAAALSGLHLMWTWNSLTRSPCGPPKKWFGSLS